MTNNIRIPLSLAKPLGRASAWLGLALYTAIGLPSLEFAPETAWLKWGVIILIAITALLDGAILLSHWIRRGEYGIIARDNTLIIQVSARQNHHYRLQRNEITEIQLHYSGRSNNRIHIKLTPESANRIGKAEIVIHTNHLKGWSKHITQQLQEWQTCSSTA
ncbi:hypothetical protein [Suttonella ornithocola]|uniref:Uncharacterized protein n=1 Tax=Suttonella ornithocola TaxID=279832 RepID=A0A380MNX9_9GAMM|nr:hypothetical protein [Suttonella ornithocola]SUO94325.1 Uncharacterised protein [Suttonella ornithocola]